jgi:hypothetical protein
MCYLAVLEVVVKYQKESRVSGNRAIWENLLYIKQSIPLALAQQKKPWKISEFWIHKKQPRPYTLKRNSYNNLKING